MKISESIKYIGVDDLNLDLFESQYVVPNGISYNSYVILDKQIAIMDTVDCRCGNEWFARLENTLERRTPDYLVLHHIEPDHSGEILRLMTKYPNLKIVASARALQMLPQFFDTDFTGRTIAVKEQDTLSLGSHTLTFMTAPMVHWPEVMVSYESSEQVLFSADAFGKFGALSHQEDWACEARRYYFNICGKYGVQVQNLLKKVKQFDIRHICPLHGPTISENLDYYIGLYDCWSSYRAETDGVFIAYASIHGGTAETARTLAKILEAKGAKKVSIADLSRCDMAEAVEDAFRMSRMVVAGASYDAGVFPPMHDFLHHLQIKNFQNRKVGIIENGSWAPCAARVMSEMLQAMKNIEIAYPIVTVHSRMKPSNLPQLEQLAEELLR